VNVGVSESLSRCVELEILGGREATAGSAKEDGLASMSLRFKAGAARV
jgi:hypothetical protein